MWRHETTGRCVRCHRTRKLGNLGMCAASFTRYLAELSKDWQSVIDDRAEDAAIERKVFVA